MERKKSGKKGERGKKETREKKTGKGKKTKEEGIEKEKVCEIFEIEKSGKEKTVQSCGIEEQETGSKEQIKKENEILKNFFIWVGVAVFAIILIIVILDSVKKFEYRGLEFNLERYGKLIFYRVRFPVTYEGKDATYNFYIRNDPRKLEKEVPFSGELVILKNLVINSTGDFKCDGDGIIAIANLLKLSVFGVEIIKDENASCDAQGRYTFLNLQPGNSSGIEKTGPSCYELNINNCEILKVTERFMVENFVKVKEDIG